MFCHQRILRAMEMVITLYFSLWYFWQISTSLCPSSLSRHPFFVTLHCSAFVLFLPWMMKAAGFPPPFLLQQSQRRATHPGVSAKVSQARTASPWALSTAGIDKKNRAWGYERRGHHPFAAPGVKGANILTLKRLSPVFFGCPLLFASKSPFLVGKKPYPKSLLCATIFFFFFFFYLPIWEVLEEGPLVSLFQTNNFDGSHSK